MASFKHPDIVAEVLDHRWVVGADNDGAPARRLLSHHPDEVLSRRGIQSRGRFVEEEEAGMVQEGPGERDALPLTAGVRAYEPVGETGEDEAFHRLA